jgi:hypothetical protein
MALQLRRGTNAQRQQIVLKQGELVFVTDWDTAGVNPVWIGNGTTYGGVTWLGVNTVGLGDIAVTAPTVNQLLQYNGTKWNNKSNITIPGTLGVTGATTLNSTLSVNASLSVGNTNNYQPVSIYGTTNIQGITTIVPPINTLTTTSILNVQGNTTIAGQTYINGNVGGGAYGLEVTGPTLLKGYADLCGNVRITSQINSGLPPATLTVDGATTLNNGLTAYGISYFGTLNAGVTTIGSAGNMQSLTVYGTTNLISPLAVSGATALGSTLNVSGAATLSSTLAVSGNAGVGGSVTAGSLYTSGLASVGGTLTVTGATTLNGDLTINGTTTTVNATTLTVDDKNIELGAVVSKNDINGTITGSGLTTTITMAGSSTTSGMIPGQALTKYIGSGIFGTNPVITSVDSATQITITSTTANTAGSIVFNIGGATDTTANLGGITLKGATDKQLYWASINNSWNSTENINVAAGKTFSIASTPIISGAGTGAIKLAEQATSVSIGAQGNVSSPTKIGINTFSPEFALDVVGNSSFWNNLIVNKSGTAGTGLTVNSGTQLNGTLTTTGNTSVGGTLTVGGNVSITGLLQQSQTTKTSTSSGVAGQISWDANYIYVCTATNVWKRVALSGSVF